jgi:hypothetical protein
LSYFRLTTSAYLDIETICYDVQLFIDLSKHNLKRISNKANPSTLIFVCSCACKKTIPEVDILSNSNIFIDSAKKGGNHLSGIIKRTNFNSCPFRISFKKQSNGEYFMKKKDKLEHNHDPESTDKVRSVILILLFMLFYF